MALHLLSGHDSVASLSTVALAVLLTYLAHALIWSLAAAALDRAVTLPSATRNVLWTVAHFAPLATTALVALTPVFVRVSGRPALAASMTRSPVHLQATDLAVQVWDGMVLGMAAALALGLLRFAGSAWSLSQSLRGRRAVQDARLIARLTALRARTARGPILLTESTRLRSPLVVGTRELCVPVAQLARLSDGELDAVLAHELAHLERLDGLRFPLIAFLETVFWMQPLSRWAAERFRQTAELACDDRAVELTGSARCLAHALARVALAAQLESPLLMLPAMARAPSLIVSRVRRLLERESSPVRAHPHARGWASAALVGMGLLAASVRVQPATMPPDVAREPPLAVPATLREPGLPELVQQARQLGAELQALRLGADTQREHPEVTARMLELEQALRHTHAQATYVERSALAHVVERESQAPAEDRTAH
ncbi:MAG: hypothetical protein JWN48_4281 [Myxococcaceae bacterium]|nr:hypothetical protein [Myxococcaceae bacterium]